MTSIHIFGMKMLEYFHYVRIVRNIVLDAIT